MSNETLSIEAPSLEAQYAALVEYEPKPVTLFVPSDGPEQKRAFLQEDTVNPSHIYGRLKDIDFSEKKIAIETIGNDLLSNSGLSPKFKPAYEAFIAGYKKRTELLELARDFNAADSNEREAVRAEFMRLNIELYGEPDEAIYRSLLHEKLEEIKAKDLTGDAASLRSELLAMVDGGASEQVRTRFAPSPETIAWMKTTVESLYDGMLAHIPAEAKTFTATEVQGIFSDIMMTEFGEVAADWRVDLESASAVNVKTTEKRIVIPKDRGEMTRAKVQALIVHEIGVHVLRSVMGEEVDLPLLKHGFAGYYDAEEGLGQVMEQARKGTFSEAGTGHYLTAGLAYHDHKDFRGAFEVKWRLAVLSKLKDNEEPTEVVIEKARSVAYGATLRIFRGTDELPWFKDLSYYNGSVDMWRYLEDIRGDDLRFMFVLLGKTDPSMLEHQRIQYETKTVTKDEVVHEQL